MKLRNVLILFAITNNFLFISNNCNAMNVPNPGEMSISKPIRCPKDVDPRDIYYNNDIYFKYHKYRRDRFRGTAKKTKYGRFNKLCRCKNCYWCGYPCLVKIGGNSNKYYSCGGCTQRASIENGFEILSKEDLSGIMTSENYVVCPESKKPHNGYIFDKRFISKKKRLTLREIIQLKTTDTPIWFYCYSCKKDFLVPMNTIQHPKSVFDY